MVVKFAFYGNSGRSENQFRGCHVIGKLRFYPVILQPLLRTGKHIHVAEYSRQAKLVLVLQVGAVAPFQNQRRDFVRARMKQVSHVKFRDAVGHLRITRKLSVHEQVDAAVNALENKYPAQSVRLVIILAAVNSRGIVVRDIRRVKRYRIVYVRVLRAVKSM